MYHSLSRSWELMQGWEHSYQFLVVLLHWNHCPYLPGGWSEEVIDLQHKCWCIGRIHFQKMQLGSICMIFNSVFHSFSLEDKAYFKTRGLIRENQLEGFIQLVSWRENKLILLVVKTAGKPSQSVIFLLSLIVYKYI